MAIIPGRLNRHSSLPIGWVPINSDRLGAGEEVWLDIGVDYSYFDAAVNVMG